MPLPLQTLSSKRKMLQYYGQRKSVLKNGLGNIVSTLFLKRRCDRYIIASRFKNHFSIPDFLFYFVAKINAPLVWRSSLDIFL